MALACSQRGARICTAIWRFWLVLVQAAPPRASITQTSGNEPHPGQDQEHDRERHDGGHEQEIGRPPPPQAG